VYYLISSAPGASLFADRPVIKASEIASVTDCAELLGDLKARQEKIEAQAEERSRSARLAGFATGVKEGRAEAKKMQAAALAAVEADLSRAAADMKGRAEGLALEIVRRIAGQQAADMVAGAVAVAIRDLGEAEYLRLVVHPAAEARTRARLAELGRNYEVDTDPSMAPTDGFIVTKDGRIEIGIDTQLDAIARALMPGEG
jgi:type III secretion protein L